MNVKAQPIFGTNQRITPRSVGYSYLPGSTLATVNPPSPIATFGTGNSPRNVGTSLLPPTVNNPGTLRGLIGSTFGGTLPPGVTLPSNVRNVSLGSFGTPGSGVLSGLFA